MTSKFSVAAVQFLSAAGETSRNAQVAESLIRESAQRGARLVVLPELAINGYDLSWIAQGAPGVSPFPSSVFERLAELGRALGIDLVINDLERSASGFYDTTLVFRRGVLAGKHRKTVPTPAEIEAGILPGDVSATPIALPETPLTVGPMICYEYGFPELAQNLVEAGANCIALSSAIRAGFEHLRDVRTCARAQDNGVYVVAANAVGGIFCGGSAIIDPDGRTVARASEARPEAVVAEVLLAGRDATASPPSSEERAQVLRAIRKRRDQADLAQDPRC